MASFAVKDQLRRSLELALIFQIGWVVASGVLIFIGVPINVNLLIILVPVLWVPAILEQIIKRPLPIALHIHYHIFITASSVGGSLWGLYALIPHWDSIVHVDSGVLIAWFGFFIVREAEAQVKRAFPKWFAISTALAMPMAFAAMWEVSEFLSDTFLHTTTQAGLEDTIVDMGVAFLGALIALALAVWWRIPKTVMPKSL